MVAVFRRELSSNRDYRKVRSSSKKSSVLSTPDWKTLSRLPSTLMQQWPGSEVDSSIAQRGNNACDKSFTLVHFTDVMLLVVGYLTNVEIARLSTASSTLNHFLTSEFVWEQLWMQRYGELWQHPTMKDIFCYRGIEWDPLRNWGPPSQGWKLFLLEFEYGTAHTPPPALMQSCP